MIKYTVYNGVTGEIIRSGEAQPTTLPHQATGPDEAVTFGEYDPETYYFRNGQPTLRPIVPQATLETFGLSFVENIPDGATLKVRSTFVETEVSLTANVVAFAVPEDFTIEVAAPWPWAGYDLTFQTTETVIPDGAMVVEPDLARMQDHFMALLYQRGEDLVTAMLGNPDEATRRRWLLKRTIFDRSLAGTLTDADRAALAEGVRYTSETIEDELAAIGAKVGFETWVTFRADGVRDEAHNRVEIAKTPTEVLTAIAWAETESAAAVAEAQALATNA